MNNLLKTARLVVAYTEVKVGNPKDNVDAMIKVLDSLNPKRKPDVILFPELSVTGYTCADLFNQTVLLEAAWRETLRLAAYVQDQIIVVGVPYAKGHTLYNCAAVLNNHRVVGLIPKTYLPNYKEFYESRWFYPASQEKCEIVEGDIPFGIDLIFEVNSSLKIGIEICEDVFAVIPPSSYQALAGATLLLNLSASNETVAKAEYRRSLVKNQSGRCIAAYAYCSAGPTESTTDLLFGGHCIVAENGSILQETERFKIEDSLVVDIDLEKLINERRCTPTFQDAQRRLPNNKFRTVIVYTSDTTICRKENKFPFVPSDPATLDKRCEEVFHIQVGALKKRMGQVLNKKFVIGVSGGLDSTLVLLVAIKACDQLGLPRTSIDAVTMPGFGTSDHTKNNADKLMELLGVARTTIDIREQCLETFRNIGHKPFGIDLDTNGDNSGAPVDLEWFQEELANLPQGATDVVFENVQARVRTMLLMSRGFVLGTGDMSELALGWCTYNGDHMSMYNVNCSIPKTLVKFLVNWVAESDTHGELHNTLKSIVATEISPELLPLKDGKIVHSTESIVGPYPLIDFFLFHLVRNNFAPRKIAALAEGAFTEYAPAQIKDWLRDFLKRFFQSQFKRNCVPDGPKVGSVSLSPRGDWRMPSDAEVDLWIKDLE